MKRPPLIVYSPGSATLFGGLLVCLFLALFFSFFMVSTPFIQAQGSVSNQTQPSEAEEDLLDFFLEAVEGVEPSGANAPAIPPLPPSSGGAKAPVALPPAAEPAGRPATQSFAPSESFTPSESFSNTAPGWTPLPGSENPPAAAGNSTPQNQPRLDPADPFNPPAVTRPESQAVPREADSAVPLGQGRAASPLPSPFWEDLSPDASYPPPESAGNWIQLEVGQSDSVSPAAPVSTGRRPTSVYSVPPPPSSPGRQQRQAAGPVNSSPDQAASAVDRAMDNAIKEPATSAQVLEPAERENLRKLFSDILPPAAQGRPTRPAPVQPAAGAVKAAGAPEVKPVVSAPAVNSEGAVKSSAISQAGGLLSEPAKKPVATQTVVERAEEGPKTAPVTPLAAKTLEEIPVQKAGPPAAESKPANKPVEAAAKVNDVKVVAAAPVPKAEKTQVVSEAEKTAENKTAPSKAQAVKAEPKQVSKPASVKTAAKAPAKKSKLSKTSGGPAPAKNSYSLIVVNETGRDRVAQQYGSVLKRLGYNVSSEVEGKAGKGLAGQTVVSYRPGFKSQAQSVSRYLPGRKVLLEAKTNQVLASEIMIYIR